LEAIDMDIEIIINNLREFYFWIYSKTGLKSWQLIIIALAILFLCERFLSYLRKARIRKLTTKSSNRSNLIGLRLNKSELAVQKHKNPQEIHLSEEEEEHQSWGQTTKDWRKLREKIRHLEHDLSKHEKLEKTLNEEIAALKIANEKLLLEIDKRRTQTTDTLLIQNHEPASAVFVQNQTEQIPKEDLDIADSNDKEQSLPLDIKELIAISDLVKRLQTRSQQRQSE
jgi:hypothetical protein